MSDKKKTAKTKGTVIAEKARAKANRFSDTKRQGLMGRAFELIYKGGQGKVRAHCR